MKFTAIKENHLYRKTFANGKRFVCRDVCVYVLTDKKAKLLQKAHPQKKKVNRIGLSVTKKIGGAVQRNRAKRIIRAGFAPFAEKIAKGNLIVIAARESIRGRKSTDLFPQFEKAFRSLGMFLPESEEAKRNDEPLSGDKKL